jgi:hypothetical protein
MNQYKAHIYSDKCHDFIVKGLTNCHIFGGNIIDDRGRALNSIIDENNLNFHLVEFNPESMEFSIDSNIINYNDISFLSNTITSQDDLFIDSTTLGLPEIYYLIKQFITLNILNFKFIYIEPLIYNKDEDANFYKLSHYPIGYKPIPGAIGDLHGDELDLGIFFVGFDSSRMEIALEEFQMIQGKKIKVVFTTPSFCSGLEMESIVPHLNILTENRNFEIDFCSALDPTSSYELLSFYRKSLDEGKQVFIAPLGTKPTTIATALFANLNEDVNLLYDHPMNLKDRTSGVKEWHIHSIFLSPIT